MILSSINDTALVVNLLHQITNPGTVKFVDVEIIIETFHERKKRGLLFVQKFHQLTTQVSFYRVFPSIPGSAK